jgi:hypothetical protein
MLVRALVGLMFGIFVVGAALASKGNVDRLFGGVEKAGTWLGRVWTASIGVALLVLCVMIIGSGIVLIITAVYREIAG